MQIWIERNKSERPFEAGALAYILGLSRYYGCHYGMRSTQQWTQETFYRGYDTASRDYSANV